MRREGREIHRSESRSVRKRIDHWCIDVEVCQCNTEVTGEFEFRIYEMPLSKAVIDFAICYVLQSGVIIFGKLTEAKAPWKQF